VRLGMRAIAVSWTISVIAGASDDQSTTYAQI